MDDFSEEEIDSIVRAINTEPEKVEEIPLKAPGNYVSRVTFSPLEGEKPRPLNEITGREMAKFGHLRAEVEVAYGKSRITLKELAALEEGSLLPLDDLCDELVDIYVNGKAIGRGEVIAADGKFGVRIVTLT